MAGLDDLLKLAERHQSIQLSPSVISQLSEMMKAQEQITKSLSGVSMITELAKSMQQHRKMFESSAQSVFEAMTKDLNLQEKFVIPQTTLDAISSINRQHEQIIGAIRRAITEALKIQSLVLAQINNLSFALSSISGQIAAIAAKQRNWDLIDDFEEITEEAVSLNERILDKNGVTKEELNELKSFFQRIEIKVDKIDADANSLFWKLLTLLGFILAVMGEARNWLPKPEYATKQEIETVIKEQFVIYEKRLKEAKEYRITNRECEVKLKPKTKTLTVSKLPKDIELFVLQVNHKWVLVSYFDPKDNLPQTGWIMKKYLDKPE